MKILAVEFSSPQRSVAVIQTGAGSSSMVSEVAETGSGTGSGLQLAEDALRKAGLEREQIECLAVGLGPGSYTGIRASIALAQGWQLAASVKLLGISSVEAIAAEAFAQNVRGNVSVVIDAQRGEFYLARFSFAPDGYREIEPLRIVPFAEAQKRANEDLLLGPDAVRWFDNGRSVYPRAATLGGLALKRTDFVSGENLKPIYLRETTFVKAPARRAMP